MIADQTPQDDSRRTVAALFSDPAQAQQAIHDLKQAGFRGEDIGLALRDRDAQGALRVETGAQAAADIGQDAASGGLLGGLVGLLVGAGALAIPGIGPIVAGGVFASVLGSTAVGAGLGMVGGGIIGALVHLGLTEHQANYFASGFHEGGVLVTVHPGGRGGDAQTILTSHGGDTGTAEGAPGSYTDYGGGAPPVGEVGVPR